MSTRVNAMRAQLTGRRLVTVMCLLAACRGGDGPPADEAAADAVACDDPAVREVVEEFGRRLNHVSLLAPDSIVEAAMREAYAPFVTAELLDRWIADPASAPGRQVSSPWPQRIEVRSTADAADAQCRVEATVIHVTSADTSTSAVREAVRILVRDVDGWRISGFERVSPGGVSPGEPSADDDGDVAPPSAPPADGSPPAEPSAAGDIEAALAAIEQYYAAIDAGDYRRAYALWSDDGAASGQSFEEFSAGFAGTSSVHVEVGEPGRIGAAAGSRFVTVPVTIHADGPAGAQTFSGTYTLRRSVVDGASAAQRSWRIHSADIR
ncbi:MAG TPA: hypothetical protein VHG09_12115 [Longimicrobiales bacterium]|nr:hypothetical protein [Longimicrobiales bacterium]